MCRLLSSTKTWVVLVLLVGARTQAATILVEQNGPTTTLSLDGGEPFHSTEQTVTGATFVA